MKLLIRIISLMALTASISACLQPNCCGSRPNDKPLEVQLFESQ